MENKKSVLIVEDDEEVAEYINFSFMQDGFSTAIAKDGDEAYRLIKSSVFNLAVIDLVLPGRSGFEIIKMLQPVIQ